MPGIMLGAGMQPCTRRMQSRPVKAGPAHFIDRVWQGEGHTVLSCKDESPGPLTASPVFTIGFRQWVPLPPQVDRFSTWEGRWLPIHGPVWNKEALF